MKENFQAEEERRKEAKRKLETQGAELEGARAELNAAQVELAKLKETSSKCREDALIEISQFQAQVDNADRKLVGVPEEIATTLAEYQYSAEFEQVKNENFDEVVRTFIYNVWHEHPKWDLSFLGEMAREMVVEFNGPPDSYP